MVLGLESCGTPRQGRLTSAVTAATSERASATLLAAIVAASNAGGSGSVVGDTTTTMRWIAGVRPRALALVPIPTEKKNQGERDVALQVQCVWIRAGDRHYADADWHRRPQADVTAPLSPA